MERTRTRPPQPGARPWIAVVYGVVLMAIAVPWMLIETTPLATGRRNRLGDLRISHP